VLPPASPPRLSFHLERREKVQRQKETGIKKTRCARAICEDRSATFRTPYTLSMLGGDPQYAACRRMLRTYLLTKCYFSKAKQVRTANGNALALFIRGMNCSMSYVGGNGCNRRHGGYALTSYQQAPTARSKLGGRHDWWCFALYGPQRGGSASDPRPSVMRLCHGLCSARASACSARLPRCSRLAGIA